MAVYDPSQGLSGGTLNDGDRAFWQTFFDPENWSSSWNDSAYAVGQFWNNISGVSASNAESARLAREQRQWEEDMDNTKYQRAVQDMKAAGINPAMLSGMSSGSVGSVPSGAAASTHAAGSNPMNSLISLLAAVIFRGSSTKSQTLMKSRDVWPNQKLWRKG